MDDVYRKTGTFKPLLRDQNKHLESPVKNNNNNQENKNKFTELSQKRFQFRIQSDLFDVNILDKLTPQQEYDIQAITPAIKKITESKLSVNDISNMNYQHYLKMVNICKFAMQHYMNKQHNMMSYAENYYDRQKELETIKRGMEELKNQHLAKKNQLVETMKNLQWQINQLKHEAENMGMYKCVHCTASFKEKITLQRHINKAHKNLVQEVNAVKMMQNEISDPTNIAKQEMIEQKHVENLQKLNKQVQNGYVNIKKEDELVERIKKLLDQKMQDKISKEFMIAENMQAQELNVKQENKQVMLDSITDLKGSIDNFKVLFDQLKEQQQVLDKQQQEYQTRLKSVLEKQKDMHSTEKIVHQNVEEYMRNPRKFFEQQLKEEQELKLEKISHERRLQEVQQLLFLKQEELDRKAKQQTKKIVPEFDEEDRQDSASEKGTNSYEVDITATSKADDDSQFISNVGGPTKRSIKLPKVQVREEIDVNLDHIGELESDEDSEYNDDNLEQYIKNDIFQKRSAEIAHRQKQGFQVSMQALEEEDIEIPKDILFPLNVNKKIMEAEKDFLKAIKRKVIFDKNSVQVKEAQAQDQEINLDKKAKEEGKEEAEQEKIPKPQVIEGEEGASGGQDVLKEAGEVLKKKDEARTTSKLEQDSLNLDQKRKLLLEKCDEMLKNANNLPLQQLKDQPIQDIEIIFTSLKKKENQSANKQQQTPLSSVNPSQSEIK